MLVNVLSAGETAMSKSEKSLPSLTLHSTGVMENSLRMEFHLYHLIFGCLAGKIT